MLDALRTLLSSKRAMIALVTLLLELALALGWIATDLDPERVEQLAGWVATIGLALVGGYSLTDAAKALSLPAGIGHKDGP